VVGICWNTLPMATETTLMRQSAEVAPASTVSLPRRMARSAAMKKVLSPSSETKMRAKAAVKPDLASAAIAACPTAVFCDTAHPAPPSIARTRNIIAACLPPLVLPLSSPLPPLPPAESAAAAAPARTVARGRCRSAHGSAHGDPQPPPPFPPLVRAFDPSPLRHPLLLLHRSLKPNSDGDDVAGGRGAEAWRLGAIAPRPGPERATAPTLPRRVRVTSGLHPPRLATHAIGLRQKGPHSNHSAL